MLNSTKITAQNRVKLAIIVSHPIQHFVPLYQRLAKEPSLDLCVFFMSEFSVKSFYDHGMAREITWKMDLLSGYNHKFLDEAGRISRASPLTLNNPSVTSALARFAPDVVLTYGYNQVTQMRALAWSRRHGVPVMMTSDSELQHHRSWSTRTAKRLLLPRLYRRYAAFITTGDNNEQYLTTYGVPRAKLFRSPFTIDESVYLAARTNRDALRTRFRTSNGIAADEFVVLTVGKLTPGKRPFDVVEVAEILQSSAKAGEPKLRFVLAGDGALGDAVDVMVKARNVPVTRLGFVNLDELPAVYCAADAVLHPSETDAHPLVMSEASCIGLPLIVSDKVGAIGPTDSVRSGENGIVTPCGDTAAIAAAVRRLATTPDLMHRMSQASLRIFSELDQSHSVAGINAAVRYCLGQPVTDGGQRL